MGGVAVVVVVVVVAAAVVAVVVVGGGGRPENGTEVTLRLSAAVGELRNRNQRQWRRAEFILSAGPEPNSSPLATC